MERALKERIVGAAVLVSIVVLVVPIFLDGPPESGITVSERVLLPGQEDQDIKTVVLERERSVPIPAVSSDKTDGQQNVVATAEISNAEVSDTDIEKPVTVIEPVATQTAPKAVVEEPPPTSTAVPPSTKESKRVASTTGMWAVQLGSFSNKENAEALAANLRKQGYAAFLSQLVKSGSQLHRVRIGPQKDRESAEEMAARLQKVGHTGQVVPHP